MYIFIYLIWNSYTIYFFRNHVVKLSIFSNMLWLRHMPEWNICFLLKNEGPFKPLDILIIKD